MAEEIKACYLYSKANYPIRLRYDGKTLILPPFANRVKIANEDKLGTLPKNVRKVTIPSKIQVKITKVEEGGK